MSLRSFARLGSCLALQGGLRLGGNSGDAQLAWNAESPASLEVKVGAARGVSLSDGGAYAGTLHGEWLLENAVTTSDRRLKRDIKPLYRTIAESDAAAKAPPGRRPGGTGSGKEQRAGVVDWVLRELRPVSFAFKQGVESKTEKQESRFGFVAQELEQVLPGLVRGEGDEQKAVVYQDLVAVLTLSAQTLQERVTRQQSRIERITGWLRGLDVSLEDWIGGKAPADDDNDDAAAASS